MNKLYLSSATSCLPRFLYIVEYGDTDSLSRCASLYSSLIWRQFYISIEYYRVIPYRHFKYCASASVCVMCREHVKCLTEDQRNRVV